MVSTEEGRDPGKAEPESKKALSRSREQLRRSLKAARSQQRDAHSNLTAMKASLDAAVERAENAEAERDQLLVEATTTTETCTLALRALGAVLRSCMDIECPCELSGAGPSRDRTTDCAASKVMTALINPPETVDQYLQHILDALDTHGN